MGDSSYAKFNFVAKRLFKRLQQLGAQPLQPISLADEQHDLGYDVTADTFIDQVFTNLVSINPLPSNLRPLDRNLPILPRWSVLKQQNSANVVKTQSIYYSTRKSDDFTVTLLENKRLTTPEHFQVIFYILNDFNKTFSFN